METKEHKKLKKLIEKYKTKLGLENYFIDTFISENTHIISTHKNETVIKKSDYLAEVMNRDIRLEEFSLAINRDAIKSDIEDTICHEMLHILLWKMTDIIENIISIANLDQDGKAKLFCRFSELEHDVIEKLIKVVK